MRCIIEEQMVNQTEERDIPARHREVPNRCQAIDFVAFPRKTINQDRFWCVDRWNPLIFRQLAFPRISSNLICVTGTQNQPLLESEEVLTLIVGPARHKPCAATG